jgi:hypothetical protein
MIGNFNPAMVEALDERRISARLRGYSMHWCDVHRGVQSEDAATVDGSDTDLEIEEGSADECSSDYLQEPPDSPYRFSSKWMEEQVDMSDGPAEEGPQVMDQKEVQVIAADVAPLEMCAMCELSQACISVEGCDHRCMCLRCARENRNTFNKCPVCLSALRDTRGHLLVKFHNVL